MKKALEYKDSNSEWIGEIPTDWEIASCRAIVFEQNNRNDKMQMENYLSLMAHIGVIPYEEKGDIGNKKPDDLKKCKIVNPGDFVINSMNYYIGSYGMSKYKGICSPVYIVLTPNESKVEPRFAFRIFENSKFQKLAQSYGNGILEHRRAINWDILKNIKIPLPPLHIQRRVLNYLDKKTSAIDSLIANKEKLIELLKEKRQAIINEAVTKGLDKNVKMKDSGIEWIGEIPEEWEVKSFKHLFMFGRGLNITKSDLLDEGIPCVSYGEIHSKYGFEVNPEINKLKCVDTEYLQSSPLSLLKHGDFIFADTSEDLKGSGNFTCLNSDTPIFAGYHSVIVRQKENHCYRYLSYLFDSIGFRAQIQSKVSGVKVFSITQGILKNILVLLPPKKKQEMIVEYLDSKTTHINCLENDINIQIEKLKEYKQSLISEVVTGKVMV